jgi:hypothetical protein
MFALENSRHTAAEHSDFVAGSWIDNMRRELEARIPFFVMDIVVVDLAYYLPHCRVRAWLRGMRVDIIWSLHLPPVYVFESPIPLAMVLMRDIPNIPVADLTIKRQAKLAMYMRIIQDDLAAGRVAEFAVIEIDRDPNGVFGKIIQYDRIPTLRTKGPEFLIVSLNDLHLPPMDRACHRLLSNSERFALQGHPHSNHLHCPSQALSRYASGNAFAVPMVAAVAGPMVNSLFLKGSDDALIGRRISEARMRELTSFKALLERET